MDNERMRIKFNDYRETHFRPNLGLIAQEIGISRSYLTEWNNGKRNCSSETLNRIDKFLRKYDTRRQL